MCASVDGTGPARDADPDPSGRSKGRGRGHLLAADGGDRQRDRERRRGADDRAADVAAKADRRDRSGPAKARGRLAADRHCERSEAILTRRRLRRIEIASSAPAPRNDAGAQGEAAVGVAKVVLSSGFSRRYTAGKREFDIEAKSLRGIIKAVDELYPGPAEHLEDETTVSH